MTTRGCTDTEAHQWYFWLITFTGTGQSGVLRADGNGGILLMTSDGSFIPADLDSLPAFACERISYFAGDREGPS